MSEMFENYPSYGKEIAEAFKHMAPQKKGRLALYGACGIGAVVIAASVIGGADHTIVQAEKQIATGAVSNVLADGGDDVRIDIVENEATPIATLFNDAQQQPSISSASETDALVKSAITDDALEKAAVKIVDDSTTELIIDTSEGITITATVRKMEDGTAKVVKMEASLRNPDTGANTKDALKGAQITEQQASHALELSKRTPDEIVSMLGYEKSTSESDVVSGIDKRIIALNQHVLFSLPDGFSAQERDSEQSSGSSSSSDATNENATSNENAASSDKDPVLGLTEQTRTWKTSSGGILSVRSENLDSSMKSSNGKEIAEKMIQYWKETSSAVATGAGQSIADTGYITQVFYEPSSGLWGYRGQVEFSDDARTVNYRRVVFIDENNDTLVSLSYRQDIANADESSPSVMDSDGLWKLFSAVPDEVSAEASRQMEDKLLAAQKQRSQLAGNTSDPAAASSQSSANAASSTVKKLAEKISELYEVGSGQ